MVKIAVMVMDGETATLLTMVTIVIVMMTLMWRWGC